MKTRSEVAAEIRHWFQVYTENALTQYQPMFWVLFWASAVLGGYLYYLANNYGALYLGQNGHGLLTVLSMSLPLLALRRLLPHAFLFLGVGMLSLL